MVQTKSNSGPIEDPALGQASKSDNKSAEGSSYGTILEASQGPAVGNTPSVGESVRLPGGQETLKNPGAMSARDSMEIDAPPDNKKSGGENEITAKIERLKKEQKKAQIRNKLRHLREHKAREFVKNILKQESYAQTLALERAKKVRDSNMYSGKN